MGLEVRLVVALEGDDLDLGDALRRVPELVATAFCKDGLELKSVTISLREKELDGDDDY
jgi:hypothetical protein